MSKVYLFNVDEAVKHGVEKAVILYNLRYWLEKTKPITLMSMTVITGPKTKPRHLQSCFLILIEEKSTDC